MSSSSGLPEEEKTELYRIITSQGYRGLSDAKPFPEVGRRPRESQSGNAPAKRPRTGPLSRDRGMEMLFDFGEPMPPLDFGHDMTFFGGADDPTKEYSPAPPPFSPPLGSDDTAYEEEDEVVPLPGTLRSDCRNDKGCKACSKVFNAFDYISGSGFGASAETFKFNINGKQQVCRAVSSSRKRTPYEKYRRIVKMLVEDFVIAVLKKRTPEVVDYIHNTGFDTEGPGLVHYVVLMDAAEHRDLEEYLGEDAPSSIEGRKEEADALYGQIWHVVAYVLPAAGIYHADVAGRNILVFEGPDGRPFAKLADFDMARLIQSDTARSAEEAIKGAFEHEGEVWQGVYENATAIVDNVEPDAYKALEAKLVRDYNYLMRTNMVSGIHPTIRDMDLGPDVISKWVTTFLDLIMDTSDTRENIFESAGFWVYDMASRLDMFSLYLDWCDRTRRKITEDDVIERDDEEETYDLEILNRKNVEAFQTVMKYGRRSWRRQSTTH